MISMCAEEFLSGRCVRHPGKAAWRGSFHSERGRLVRGWLVGGESE